MITAGSSPSLEDSDGFVVNKQPAHRGRYVGRGTDGMGRWRKEKGRIIGH